MKIVILALVLASTLSGCATDQYAQYAKANEAMSVARSNALAAIAAGSSGEAKVAAVMALALGGVNQIQAPQNEALTWASILVPGLAQVYGIRQSSKVAMNASTNAMLTAGSTNAAFVGMASQIQAPVVATPQANIMTTNTTNTTLSGTGVLGSGAYSTDTHNVTGSYNPVTYPFTPVTVGP